ncbi:MAG: hypothetical protein Salg2KO_20550 [Salibacteraceae bacterium]
MKLPFHFLGLNLLLLGWVLHGEAQPNHEVEGGVFGGKMLNIYPNFPTTKWHSGIFIAWRHWAPSVPNEQFGKPQTGFILSYHNMGNQAVLGIGLGAQYEIAWRQNLSSRIYVQERFRPGVLFANKPYDSNSNPKNIVIGSHLSALMGVSFGIGYRVSKGVRLNLDCSVWHSSNGHTALPNVGMNSPLMSISFSYSIPTKETNEVKLDIRHDSSSVQLVLGAAIGFNEAGGTVRPVNTGLYQKYLTSIGVGYRFRDIHRVTAALEGYFDQTYSLWNQSQEWPDGSDRIRSSALMLMLGHEFIYQRWGLIINGGVNIYNPTLNDLVGQVERKNTANTIKRYVPGRFAIRYYLQHPWRSNSSPYVQAGIKSNFGQADFLEFGLGWVISSPRR